MRHGVLSHFFKRKLGSHIFGDISLPSEWLNFILRIFLKYFDDVNISKISHNWLRRRIGRNYKKIFMFTTLGLNAKFCHSIWITTLKYQLFFMVTCKPITILSSSRLQKLVSKWVNKLLTFRVFSWSDRRLVMETKVEKFFFVTSFRQFNSENYIYGMNDP